MPCCGGPSCACKIESSDSIEVSGTGSSQDPFILETSSPLTVTDNSTFNLILTGSNLEVAYAVTAKLDDIPDVEAPAPTNAQVLGWDTATSRWTPRAPTTAASGSVTHDTSLSGDGSGGSPLQVVEDPIRFLVTVAAGLGLSDAGINMLVRGFVDSAARTAADPVPDLNALSMLDVAPGRIDYWTGSAWAPVPGLQDVDVVGQLLALSGSYVTGMRVRQVIRQVTTDTDSGGVFAVLTAADLTGAAGVLTAQFQEVYPGTGAAAYKAVLQPAVDRIDGVAYRLDDGTPYLSQTVNGTLIAYLY